MAITVCLFLVLVSRILVQGTMLDPQNPEAVSAVHYHCLHSTDPLQFKDPFSPSEIESPKFISMEWYRNTSNSEKQLLFVCKTSKRVMHPTVSIFEFWGIQGTMLDPQNPEAVSAVHYHCLHSTEPLQFKDPFSPSEIESPKFISMEWYRYTSNSEQLLLIVGKASKKVMRPTVSVFEFWGIQINNVSLDDNGTYTAKLIRLSPNKQVSLQVSVIEPPMLKSGQLTITRTTYADRIVIVSCGPILTLGKPPVSIVFKDFSGHLQYSVNTVNDGFAQFRQEGVGSATRSCEVDCESSLASICIMDKSTWIARVDDDAHPVQPMAGLWIALLVMASTVAPLYS